MGRDRRKVSEKQGEKGSCRSVDVRHIRDPADKRIWRLVAKNSRYPAKFGVPVFRPSGPVPRRSPPGSGHASPRVGGGSGVPKSFYDLRFGPHDVGEDREMSDPFNMGWACDRINPRRRLCFATRRPSARHALYFRGMTLRRIRPQRSARARTARIKTATVRHLVKRSTAPPETASTTPHLVERKDG